MRIVVSSIFVDDQDNALAFYTTKLGFVKKADIVTNLSRTIDWFIRRAVRGELRTLYSLARRHQELLCEWCCTSRWRRR